MGTKVWGGGAIAVILSIAPGCSSLEPTTPVGIPVDITGDPATMVVRCRGAKASGNGTGKSCESEADACNKAKKDAKTECNTGCGAYSCENDGVCVLGQVAADACTTSNAPDVGACPGETPETPRDGFSCTAACTCPCACG